MNFLCHFLEFTTAIKVGTCEILATIFLHSLIYVSSFLQQWEFLYFLPTYKLLSLSPKIWILGRHWSTLTQSIGFNTDTYFVRRKRKRGWEFFELQDWENWRGNGVWKNWRKKYPMIFFSLPYEKKVEYTPHAWTPYCFRFRWAIYSSKLTWENLRLRVKETSIMYTFFA